MEHAENRGYLMPLIDLKIVCQCFLIGQLLLVGSTPADDNYCDPFLTTNPDHPFGYQNRKKNRCEGIYIQQVSGSTLHIASFTESFEDYDLNSDKNLLIEWTPTDDQAIHLRAYSLKRKVYYRMDTTRDAGSSSYTWPTDVLRAYDMKRKSIGVVAWTKSLLRDVERNIYLPIRLSQQEKPAQTKEYKLILIPGRELKEVYVSLTKLGTDGKPESVIQDGEALNYGYYPAGRGLTVPVTKLNGSGIYYVEIGATLRGGGTTNKDLWFYHPKKLIDALD